MSEAPARRTLPIGLTVATAISLAILVGLGVWQLERLHWKQGVITRIAALQAAPAQTLVPVLDRLKAGEDVDFTRVVVDCPGLSKAPYLELFGLRDGQAGSRLISACALKDAPYGSILVDRGFVADTISARPPVDASASGPMRMTGVLRTPDRPTFVTPANDPAGNRWYARDVPAMAAQLKATSPAPIFLFAETSTNPKWRALVPAPVPAEIPNRHLEYALTWFGLAGALLAVYAAMLWRRWKN